MNRNTEAHFHELPTVTTPRSRFDRSSNYKTTFNAGKIIPVYADELLPGDTVSLDMSGIIRMSTPIAPVMDDAFMDIYFFAVPNRLIWQHWKEFCGENNSTYWEQPATYTIPQIKAPTGGWAAGTLADYFGLPTKIENISVNALPFRAYCKIFNDWFRDENLMQPANMPIDDTTVTGSNGSDPVLDPVLGGMPLNAAKIHDYFTSALPEPQKGPDVTIPLGKYAPVKTNGTDNPAGPSQSYLRWGVVDGSAFGVWNEMHLSATSGDATHAASYAAPNTAAPSLPKLIYPSNLITDLSNAASATIAQLRQAFALQQLYETDARCGTRYTEIIRGHFGVTSPDARQQRSEYLGGARVTINMDQVVQTSSTDNTSPQGNTAAMSATGFNESLFTYSATEHEYIIGLVVVRNALTYQQGINRMWSRKDRFDFYYPALANLSEQAILNKEIYAQGTAADDEVFGYQEAWAELRYKPSIITGEMRSNYAQSLDIWHYGEDYDALPTLSSSWIQASDKNIERTLAVTTENANQFIADFYFRDQWTRPLPIYSIPGLKKL